MAHVTDLQMKLLDTVLASNPDELPEEIKQMRADVVLSLCSPEVYARWRELQFAEWDANLALRQFRVPSEAARKWYGECRAEWKRLRGLEDS